MDLKLCFVLLLAHFPIFFYFFFAFTHLVLFASVLRRDCWAKLAVAREDEILLRCCLSVRARAQVCVCVCLYARVST